MLWNLFQWSVFAFGIRVVWVLIRDFNKPDPKPRQIPGERKFY